MKNIFRTISALAAIAAFASCAEQIDNPAAAPGDSTPDAPSSVEFVPMTFSTSPDEDVESKTTYLKRHVYWEETDEISVFSVGAEGVNSKGIVSQIAPDNTWVEFTAPADPDAASYYAVYPYSETNACDAEGNLTVSIPSVQTAVESGVMSGANTSVAYSVESAEGNKLQFRNVAALISVSFDAATEADMIESVCIKAKKNDTEFWGLTGAAKVSFDDNMLPVIEEGNVEYVTLNAPEEGFKSGIGYFIPVYSVGDCKGFEVTFESKDGTEYVKTNSISAVLERNVLFNIGAIPNPCYPDSYTFTLDFTKGWPFNEPCLDAAEQMTYVATEYFGEPYTYVCKNFPNADGQPVSEDLIFYLSKGRVDTNNYSYTDKEYWNGGADTANNNAGSILLPGIEGQYLTRVKVVINKNSSDRLALADPTKSDKRTTAAYAGDSYTSYIFDIYADGCVTTGKTTYLDDWLKATAGKSIEIRVRNGGLSIKSVTLTYTKVKPGNAPTIE